MALQDPVISLPFSVRTSWGDCAQTGLSSFALALLLAGENPGGKLQASDRLLAQWRLRVRIGVNTVCGGLAIARAVLAFLITRLILGSGVLSTGAMLRR